jgi:DNA processing protein
LGFSLIHDVGTKKIKQLQDHFGSLQSAWNAPVQELRELGWSYQAIQDMQNERSKLNLEHELRRVELVKAFLLCLADSNYPPSLRVIDSPPASPVTCAGRCTTKIAEQFALLERARQPRMGAEIAYRFSHDLAQLGYTIIGGFQTGLKQQRIVERLMQAGARLLCFRQE